VPIAAASDAFARHLRSRLEEAGALEGWTVRATTLREARAKPDDGIALVLWRVQPDEPSGGESPLRAASQADPPEGVGLRLRYLLVVRGADAGAEQTMLGRCMAALDQHPVVQDADAPGGTPRRRWWWPSSSRPTTRISAWPTRAGTRPRSSCLTWSGACP
jgi:hypothetical protein